MERQGHKLMIYSPNMSDIYEMWCAREIKM